MRNDTTPRPSVTAATEASRVSNEARAREVLATAQADCACRIPSPFDEVAEHAIALAFRRETSAGAGEREERAREMLLALVGPRYGDTALRVATDWLKQEARLATPPAQTAGREAIAAIIRGQMREWWDEICSDTGCHPLDIVQEGRRKLSYRDGHWTDAVARFSADAILALATPSAPADASADVLALREALGGLELAEDGYSLRTTYDGDADDDGRSIVVGGEIVVTFADSDEGDRVRMAVVDALGLVE